MYPATQLESTDSLSKAVDLPATFAHPFPFQQFETLSLTTAGARHLRLAGSQLMLRRVWPRSTDCYGLEYVDAKGTLVPGQWFESRERLKKVARTTARPAPEKVLVLEDLDILLQVRGADRRLRGLSALLDQPGAKLVAHRPERRAVVQKSADGMFRYAKAVRPERAAHLASKMQRMHHLAALHFQTPAVLEVDESNGVIWLSALPGISLNEHLRRGHLVNVAASSGRALRSLHALPAPDGVKTHDAAAEVEVIQHWLRQLAQFAPARLPLYEPVAKRVCQALGANSLPEVLLHRDFYDKQIFVADDGTCGLLDFDTLAYGEAALDVANALVHMELRALQGDISTEQGHAAKSIFLEAYGPTPALTNRLPAYMDATRLRLACVYAFRPYGVRYANRLFHQIEVGG